MRVEKTIVTETCDRCGREGKTRGFAIKRTGILNAILLLPVLDVPELMYKDSDLCEDCWDSFRTWFGAKKGR